MWKLSRKERICPHYLCPESLLVIRKCAILQAEQLCAGWVLPVKGGGANGIYYISGFIPICNHDNCTACLFRQ